MVVTTPLVVKDLLVTALAVEGLYAVSGSLELKGSGVTLGSLEVERLGVVAVSLVVGEVVVSALVVEGMVVVSGPLVVEESEVTLCSLVVEGLGVVFDSLLGKGNEVVGSSLVVEGLDEVAGSLVAVSVVIKLSDVTLGSLVDKGFELGVVNSSVRFSPTFCLNLFIKFPGGL